MLSSMIFYINFFIFLFPFASSESCKLESRSSFIKKYYLFMRLHGASVFLFRLRGERVRLRVIFYMRLPAHGAVVGLCPPLQPRTPKEHFWNSYGSIPAYGFSPDGEHRRPFTQIRLQPYLVQEILHWNLTLIN
jgi:hypothetical protein